MNFAETFQLAIKNILSSKVRSLLTMLGIIIGVAAVIVIVGMGNGMQNYMTSQFQSMGTNLLTVNIMGTGSSHHISVKDMYALVEKNPKYLTDVSPTVTVNGSVKIGSETLDKTSVTGVSETYDDMKQYDIHEGRFIQYVDILNRNKVCAVGSYIANDWFNGNAVGKSLKINGTTFAIAGVVAEESESEEGGTDDAVYLPYTTAAILASTGTISSYTFEMTSEDNVSDTKAILEDALYDVYKTDDAYSIISMSEMMDMMSSMINIVVTVLAAIAAISLAVGGIGIMNIMLVSVSERTREIGIRKSLGAKQRFIMRQFVIEAATTSALGGIAGIGFGYILSFIATEVITKMLSTSIQVTPSMTAVLEAFTVSVAIGIIFGYLPAKKAARLNPIDALRYE
ncbi:ABC transporter permease [Candidatus Formimonas warabiya]|uniref:ABC transporter permease n=1 Tax=Formimonas warabiya TaxID=1761012 RepID=A0A3G1KMU3_FORW1|nr:ABC transporter permease [Candidatus Formimonas warabiya]ATW23788.1 ABC transporter permease [Candidatus Formimonas warabiya]